MLLTESKVINDIFTLIIKGAVYTAIALVYTLFKDFCKNIFDTITHPTNFINILLTITVLYYFYKLVSKIQFLCDIGNIIKVTAKDSF
jgi:hypothetical protein